MRAIVSVSLSQNVRHVDGPSRRMCSSHFQGKEILKLPKLFLYCTVRGQRAPAEECSDCCMPVGRKAREGVKLSLTRAKVSPAAVLALGGSPGNESPPNKRRWHGMRRRDQLILGISIRADACWDNKRGCSRARSQRRFLSAAAWLYMIENYSNK